MRKILVACLAAAALMSGCAVRYSASSGSATTSAVSVSSGTFLGNAIIIGMMLADGMQYFGLGSSDPQHPDPGRAINVQDCTRPVDLSAGNLFCR